MNCPDGRRQFCPDFHDLFIWQRVCAKVSNNETQLGRGGREVVRLDLDGDYERRMGHTERSQSDSPGRSMMNH